MPAPPILTRPATADDAVAIQRLLSPVFHPLDIDVVREIQTGAFYFVAAIDETLCGAVRYHDDEGVAFIERLLSVRAGAGRLLVRAAERRAQDRGVRWLRAVVPEGPVGDWFRWLGYLPIGRELTADGATLLVEKRLPLLTVREQRRDDAEAIATLAAIDPWPLSQAPRPGWFVLADGERVVGVTSVAAGPGDGVARIEAPQLLPRYRGRRLETWMIERAATFAATRGFRTARVPADPELRALERDLEDQRWFREGDSYSKDLADVPLLLGVSDDGSDVYSLDR